MYSCKFLPKTKSNHKIDPEYRGDTNKLISSRDNQPPCGPGPSVRLSD